MSGRCIKFETHDITYEQRGISRTEELGASRRVRQVNVGETWKCLSKSWRREESWILLRCLEDWK